MNTSRTKMGENNSNDEANHLDIIINTANNFN